MFTEPRYALDSYTNDCSLCSASLVRQISARFWIFPERCRLCVYVDYPLVWLTFILFCLLRLTRKHVSIGVYCITRCCVQLDKMVPRNPLFSLQNVDCWWPPGGDLLYKCPSLNLLILQNTQVLFALLQTDLKSACKILLECSKKMTFILKTRFRPV